MTWQQQVRRLVRCLHIGSKTLGGKKKTASLLKCHNAIVFLGKNCLAHVKACIDRLATALEKKTKSKWKLMTQRNVPGVQGPLGVKWLTPGNMKLLEMSSTLMNDLQNMSGPS